MIRKQEGNETQAYTIDRNKKNKGGEDTGHERKLTFKVKQAIKQPNHECNRQRQAQKEALKRPVLLLKNAQKTPKMMQQLKLITEIQMKRTHTPKAKQN